MAAVTRRPVPPALRALILERWAGNCHICGEPVARSKWEVEHVRPLWDGGADDASNLAPAHASCHLEKTVAESGVRAKVKRLILSTARHKKAVTEKRRSPNATERKKQRMEQNFNERWTTISKRMGD